MHDSKKGGELPLYDILAAFPFCATVSTAPFPVCGIQRRGYPNKDICCIQLWRKIRLDGNFIGNSGSGMFSYYRMYAEGEMNVRSCSVSSLATRGGRGNLINSNSPSGGMKDIVLSESNLASLTHWWN